MLFACFLAENNVLIHPGGVAVTLEECEELAPDEGAENGWELAARYAAERLPQIFRPDAPVLEVKLPPESQRELERLLADLPPEIFKASDSLGWVYQFWQAKKKEEVNKSEVKIGADELPAVTQLFTEPYMVQFLLHNTLGAWWVGRHDRESLPVDMPYLRFLDDGTPAAGTFDGWPDTAAEITVLDPCCGSGHFLVAAFEILVHFRMAEEKLSPAEACDAVLRDNIHGLEIDERCTQIAAFALALAAWTFPAVGGHRGLPEMHIACSGRAPRSKKEEWLVLAGDDERLQNGMARLYDLFTDAPVLGSLIDPRRLGASDRGEGKLFEARFGELRPLLERRLCTEESKDTQRYELGVAAQGIVAAAELLAGKYHFVVTNVPFLARGKQGETLRGFSAKSYAAAKNDLATVFMERCLAFNTPGGTSSLVLPQNWLFLTRYRKLREKLLKQETWQVLARLGEGGFNSSAAAGAFTALLTITHHEPYEDQTLVGLDVSELRKPEEKAAALLSEELKEVEQKAQLDSPDSRITLVNDKSISILGDYALGIVGIQTADDSRYVLRFWEVGCPDKRIWELMVSSPEHFNSVFEGHSWLLRWERGRGNLSRQRNACIRGLSAIGTPGVLVHRMRQLYTYIYNHGFVHQNPALIVPISRDKLLPIWCFCSSSEYYEAVRRIDQKLNVTNATLVKVPFDLGYWQKVADENYPNGLPKPYSDDPTQWLFHGHPKPCAYGPAYDPPWPTPETLKPSPISEEGANFTLQVAVARLLGYRWLAELELSAESAEEENSKNLSAPSAVCQNLELSDEAYAWIERTRDFDDLIDDDGIVCLPPVRGEQPAVTLVQRVLARAFGDEWSPRKQAELLTAIGCKGWTLERWLQDKFFAQHCKVFQSRPFIWHIWDGLKKGGFSALVNYHKLDRKLLETLTYNYLGDWIRRQQDGVKRGKEGAPDRLVAAKGLQEKLKLILKGEPPCDIFVRWKPIEEQPMGWGPDINDGVRVNIRPFLLVGDVGKKGAGVLRDKPNIKWGKDRGKDPPDSPWYHLFKGDRINDHHLTLAEKQAAREEQGVST